MDQYLQERRQGLLLSENLTDALTLALDFETPKSSAFGGALSSMLSSPVETPAQKLKPKPKQSALSSFVSFLTPKKNKPVRPTPSEPTTPSCGGARAVDASPFGPHYQKTPTSHQRLKLALDTGEVAQMNTDEEDVFGSPGQWGGENRGSQVVDDSDEEEDASKVTHVTLSQLLDNVVILQESIEELMRNVPRR